MKHLPGKHKDLARGTCWVYCEQPESRIHPSILAVGSSHRVMADKPDLVAKSILRMVDKIGKQ